MLVGHVNFPFGNTGVSPQLVFFGEISTAVSLPKNEREILDHEFVHASLLRKGLRV